MHVVLQAPSTHVAVPLVLLHTCPHPPQWFVLVCVLVSQPFCAIASQFANPVVHDGLHAPLTHAVVPLALMHCTPHAPQLPKLVPRFVSQPFCRFPSQLS